MARCWVNTPPRGLRRARGTWGPWRWAAEMVKLCGDRTQFTIEWREIPNTVQLFTLPLATTTPWLPDCCGRQVHLKGGSSRNWSTGSAVSIGAVSLPFTASCGMVRTYVELKELCLGLSWWRLGKGWVLYVGVVAWQVWRISKKQVCCNVLKKSRAVAKIHLRVVFQRKKRCCGGFTKSTSALICF